MWSGCGRKVGTATHRGEGKALGAGAPVPPGAAAGGAAAATRFTGGCTRRSYHVTGNARGARYRGDRCSLVYTESNVFVCATFNVDFRRAFTITHNLTCMVTRLAPRPCITKTLGNRGRRPKRVSRAFAWARALAPPASVLAGLLSGVFAGSHHRILQYAPEMTAW